MTEKTSQFLGLFNDLERYLKDLLQEYSDNPRSFKSMVGIAGKKSAFIKSKAEILYDLADLRNFLVHEYGKSIYAYPTDEALEILGGILGALNAGKKLIDVCGGKPVIIDAGATLAHGLKLINAYGYAQLPVYDGSCFKGLLNGNIITRWLAANTGQDGRINTDMDGVHISDILNFAEAKDEAALLPQDISVVDFYNIVQSSPARSGVYIITPTGKPDERPLGIVTNHDIPGVLSELDGATNTP